MQRGSRSANRSNYFHIISPFHQKIADFESRIRKWRIFKRSTTASHFHRSTSQEPSAEAIVRVVNVMNNNNLSNSPHQPGCHTTPISRKQFEIMLSRRPRPNLDQVSSSSDNFSPREVDARFEAIKENSGTLNFGIKIYKGLTPDDLEDVNALGEGTCGCVTHSRYNGRSMAVKRMKRTDNHEESKRIFMDLDVITKCSNPYIIKCIGYMITFENIFICMEMMATCFDKVLQKYNSGLPEVVLGKVAMSVVNALDYLKDTHKIMHRDIKPSNILMDWYGNVKLCDFGISGKLIDSKASTMSAGCTAYLAPERINADGGYEYDVRADVWSLGITLVQLARGAFPYYSTSPFELMITIREEKPPVLRLEEGFSIELCNLVQDCLQKNMFERPKFKELLQKNFIIDATKSNYDVGAWYRNECLARNT